MLVKRPRMILLSMGFLAAGVVVGMPLRENTAQAVVVAGSQPSTNRHEHERHPEIRMAIYHLEEAKHNFEKADHDFDGHREKALRATEEALKECRDALEVDKK